MTSETGVPTLSYEGVDLTKIAEAIDCWKQGMVDREISEKMALPSVYVSSIRKMLGLKPNWKHVSTRARRKAAKAMSKDGVEVTDIAKLLKVPAAQARLWLETDGE